MLSSSVISARVADVPQFEIGVHASIADVPRACWRGLLPSKPESWDYHRALARLPDFGFTFGAITASHGGRVVGALPIFRTTYRVDDPLGGWFRPVGDWLERHSPSMIAMPVIGVGHPFADECDIAVAPSLPIARKQAVLAAMLDALASHAADTRAQVLSLKDVTDTDRAWADPVLAARRYSRIPSLPVAELALSCDSLEDYLAGLSPSVRQDLRRKMRQAAAAGVRTVMRDSMAGLEGEIAALYEETHANRKVSFASFDHLPDGYFSEVMAALGSNARLMLHYAGDRLLAFNVFFVERDRLIGKHLGMRYPEGRKHNLYFVNWLEMVRYAIANGCSAIQAGQTSYAVKVRLGCTLRRSWVYGKHTGAFRGPLFRLLSPLAAFDKADPDLAALGERAPYVPAAPA